MDQATFQAWTYYTWSGTNDTPDAERRTPNADLARHIDQGGTYGFRFRRAGDGCF